MILSLALWNKSELIRARVMTNLFDDILIPGSPGGKQSSTPSLEPPILNSSKSTAIGCWLIAGSAFVLLILVLGIGGFFLVRRQMRVQQEIAQAEKAREAAEAQRRYIEELNANKEANALKYHEEVERMRGAEEERMQRARQAGEQEAKRSQEAARIAREEGMNYSRLQHITQGLTAFRMQADSDYVLPNGGDKGSGLSWRVHLLPYLGLKSLYLKFDLNQPWDSPQNLPLIAEIPDLYGPAPEGKTRLRTFLNADGVGAPYLQSRQVVDGLDQTIVVVCVGRDKAIEWTKPDDLESELQSGDLYEVVGWPSLQSTPTPEDEAMVRLGFPKAQYFFLFGDLVLQAWLRESDQKFLKAMFTPNKGELVRFSRVPEGLDVQQLIEPELSSPAMTSDQELKAVQSQLEVVAKGVKELREAMLRDSGLIRQNPDLSWRVYLLPYIGHDELYRKFKLDEPWHSQHNFALIAEMPEVFRVTCSQGRTRICLPSSHQNLESISLTELANPNADAPELTTILYYAAPQFSNYWTRPDFVKIDDNRFSESLGWKKGNPVVAATLAGNSIILPRNLHRSKIAALRSIDGRESFDLEKELGEPLKPLRQTPQTQPATPIKGLVTLPVVQAVPLSAELANSASADDEARLKKVSFAVLNFENAFRTSPTQLKNSQGQPSQLSWRVHVLPYLEQKALYDKFALDEPWDSETNLAAAALMPEVYRGTTQTKDKTDICTISGNGSLLSSNRWISQCVDSLSNTIMLVQVGDDQRVPWTKPVDIELKENLRFEDLVGQKAFLLIALGDSQVFPLAAKLPGSIFTALATTRGLELVDAATVRRLSLHTLGLPVTSERLRSRSESNRLKDVSMAILNYENAMRFFPPERNHPPGNIPVENYCLSWRVHILPFMGYAALHQQFRLQEPWDSLHNRQLIPLMPDVFRDEDASADSFRTRVQVVLGPQGPFPEIGEAMKRSSISDGASNTLMVMLAPKAKSVPWTQPADYEVDLAKADFKELRTSEGVAFSTFDGAVKRLAPDFDVNTLKALITIQGGEVIDPDLFQR